MSISFKALRYFSAVAETGSISSAMQTLNVSQAAVTESIQRLENHLGALLFRRHARGMALTHAGHEFLRHSQVILNAVTTAESALAIRPDTLRGELSIGVVSPLTGYYLPSLLERYRRSFPRIKVRIAEESSTMIEHQIINGELDIALTLSSHLENPQAFHTSALAHSPWRLWLPAGHRLVGTDPVALLDLAHESVIILRNEEIERMTVDLWRRAGIRPQVTVKTRSVEAARSLVATGSGIAVLPEVLFRQWSIEGTRLVAQPLHNEPTPLALGLIWRRGADVSAPTNAFIVTAAEHKHAAREAIST
jgi:DNA-binding transcriptional LysR family regulator